MNLQTLIAITCTIFSAQVLSNTETQASFEQLHSTSGYPYDMLINRSETVKIFYTVNKQGIECSVKLKRSDLNWSSQSVVVDKEKFELEPLVSCLSRKLAKQWLSETF